MEEDIDVNTLLSAGAFLRSSPARPKPRLRTTSSSASRGAWFYAGTVAESSPPTEIDDEDRLTAREEGRVIRSWERRDGTDRRQVPRSRAKGRDEKNCDWACSGSHERVRIDGIPRDSASAAAA